jgi:surfactin synthase thioesterase subunit
VRHTRVIHLTRPTRLWLRRLHRFAECGPPLVLFPHAGGAASAYRPLADLLAPAFDVLAVQYPGRQDRLREPPRTRLHQLADEITEVLLPLARPGPLALFGHSMGAIVAFEVAVRLEAAGCGPAALAVSGQRAPGLRHDEGVHRRDDDGLVAEVHRLGGTDPVLLADEDAMRTVLPAVRADYAALETYRVQAAARLRCPLVVTTGVDDPDVTRPQVEAWREYTADACEVHHLAGGHFYLDENLPRLAAILDAGLSRRPTAAPGGRARSGSEAVR